VYSWCVLFRIGDKVALRLEFPVVDIGDVPGYRGGR
jgi:hypothetical protein